MTDPASAQRATLMAEKQKLVIAVTFILILGIIMVRGPTSESLGSVALVANGMLIIDMFMRMYDRSSSAKPPAQLPDGD